MSDDELPKDIVAEVYIDDIIDIPIYEGRRDNLTRTIIMEKVDRSLSEQMDIISKYNYTDKYNFAKKVLRRLYNMIKRLKYAGYEHNDLNSGNIGYIEKDKSFDLKLIDLVSIEKAGEDKFHFGWISRIYFDLLETLELAEVSYESGDFLPDIISWNGTPLYPKDIINSNK